MADVIGITGVLMVLWAYFLIQANRVKHDDFSYSLLNLFGALMILFSLYFHWNLASVLIELAWIIISLYGLSKAYKKEFNSEIR